MKKLILTILFTTFTICNAQDWEIKASYGQLFLFPRVEACVAGEVAYNVTNRFAFAVDCELFSNRESNVTAMLKTYVVNNLTLCTGFGWGHQFTSAVLDHNYHTYSIGIENYVNIPSSRLAVSFTPMCEWRTYAEHIGFRREFFRLSTQFGVTYKFK